MAAAIYTAASNAPVARNLSRWYVCHCSAYVAITHVLFGHDTSIGSKWWAETPVIIILNLKEAWDRLFPEPALWCCKCLLILLMDQMLSDLVLSCWRQVSAVWHNKLDSVMGWSASCNSCHQFFGFCFWISFIDKSICKKPLVTVRLASSAGEVGPLTTCAVHAETQLEKVCVCKTVKTLANLIAGRHARLVGHKW